MTYKIRDLVLTIKPSSENIQCSSNLIDLTEIHELRTMVQQAFARAEVAVLESQMKPQTASQIDNLKAKIKACQDDLAARKKTFPQYDHERVASIDPSTMNKLYRVGDLVISVLPSIEDIGGEVMEPPTGTGPSHIPGPDIGLLDPYVNLEINSVRALLEHALLRLDGHESLFAKPPATLGEVEILQMRLENTLDILEDMRHQTKE
jgi:hypothetical protein